jgi:nicotinate-nucleotide pyrophosphorylase (carboxylating)
VSRKLGSGVDPFEHPSTAALIASGLAEDVGRGDVTSLVTIPTADVGTARLVAREGCVVAGLPLIERIYDALAGRGVVSVKLRVREGASVKAGRALAELRGPLATILTGERLALNFLQQLCGTATVTRRFVDAVEGTGAEILDTRKTIPGLRLLQKYAVRVGGGRNHRFGLDDGILIKDNHVAACGSVRAAVERARRGAPHGLRVEVECDRLEQVKQALAAGADVVLLDNMTPAVVGRAHALVAGRAVVEVSGGIGLDNVRKYAERAPTLISVGGLTHSAPAIDLSLEVKGAGAGRKS